MTTPLARLQALADDPADVTPDAAVAAVEALAQAGTDAAPEIGVFTAVLKAGARLGARDQARLYRAALPLAAGQPRYAKLLTDRIVAAEAGAHDDEHDAALDAQLTGADAATLRTLLTAAKDDPGRRLRITERLVALERTPGSLTAHAAALKAAGQPRAARTVLEELLTLEQPSAATRRTRARLVAVLRATGRQDDLRAAREVALPLHADAPEDLTALRLLATIAAELGELGEAERLLVLADELDPGNATTVRDLQTLSVRLEEAGEKRAQTRVEGLLQRRSAAALDRRST